MAVLSRLVGSSTRNLGFLHRVYPCYSSFHNHHNSQYQSRISHPRRTVSTSSINTTTTTTSSGSISSASTKIGSGAGGQAVWQQQQRKCATNHPSAHDHTATAATVPPLASQDARPGDEYVLRHLPLKALLRSLAVLSISSLPPSAMNAIIRAARRHSGLIQSSRFLHYVVERTFYDNFCLGKTRGEIERSMSELRRMGVSGTIVSFAREASADAWPEHSVVLAENDPQLQDWIELNLETIDRLQKGDFLALKCTGAGAASIKFMENWVSSSSGGKADAKLKKSLETQSKAYREASRKVCAAARDRGVGVLIDAEEDRVQAAIDELAVSLMSEFNRGGTGVVYNTYQMYLKKNQQKIRNHLRHAADNDFVLGVKMVRGAYMHTEPDRSIIHNSKADTDTAYDATARFLMLGGRVPVAAKDNALKGGDGNGKPWKACLVLASHNPDTVSRALDICSRNQLSTEGGGELQSLGFAQLMGMADELSLKLVAEVRRRADLLKTGAAVPPPAVARKGDGNVLARVGLYKATIWGSLGECLLYMLRRAEENRDATARSRDSARAIWKELGRRMFRLA
ncbi:hypothetical protein MKZ38_004447 [Zalerion maritima]|uniref:Proline dehydrogenase n=1 Tax=Zalerion maritima TaxID=339359 RepID=A0AAD5RY58_9PEZI|nr:hypothetical protein MKZ38_004447 [Zalerion maritima]